MPALLETRPELHNKKQISKGKVLLTGGSGFIASHVLDHLLDYGFEVVVTVRSEEKGRTIVKTLKDPSHRCSFAVVEDIAKEGAYDALFQSTADSGGAEKPFDYVVHTASPYQLHVEDPVRDFLDPAIKGTTGLLQSILAHAPSVRRVVITSSSAAVINPKNHAKVYDETHWPPVTWEDAMDTKSTYRCSKVFSEKAAWAIANGTDPRPNFDLVTLNPTYNFGPIQRGLPRLSSVNASNARIRDLVLGVNGPQGSNPGLPPTAPVFTFVDVRDVALAHLRALTVPEAGHIAAAVARHFPELRDRLPADIGEALDDLPADIYGFDSGKSRKVLGIEYRGLEESVVDTVRSMLSHEDAQGIS
ncbi:hypothetical protein PG996_002176 [Apiospora saccharicola]|uniref:NAD-dependent epimerase/dehydratase domain-containing protein n=1 Tax=Apiospora saccharicola TaxID=335842 RepID=A0ABR1WIR1_9PEZI